MLSLLGADRSHYICTAVPLTPCSVSLENKADMKSNAKIKSLMEIILALFIAAFILRAIPNLNVLHLDSPEIDDRYWGEYARIEFMGTHPIAGKPTLKPVRPENNWLQQRPHIVKNLA
jgi:hypothetical protein